jgi:flavin reductase (DIM6/NTAB) family NADH-FMN oxidoreductase RutF
VAKLTEIQFNGQLTKDNSPMAKSNGSEQPFELSSEDNDAIGRVLGRTPSGVFILTAIDGQGRSTGMLASWVQQAGFEPPSLTVAVNAKRYLNEWLKASPKLALNLLGEGQHSFLKHFGRGFEPDQPAFEGVNTAESSLGLPVLADALGYLEGTITAQMEAGDHIIYLLKVEHAHEHITELKPMVHIRKNGFNY